MNEDGNKYKRYLVDISCSIKTGLEKILVEAEYGECKSDDYIVAVALAYYDIVSSMKEIAEQFGIQWCEVGIDVFNENDILALPTLYEEIRDKKLTVENYFFGGGANER